MIVGGFFAVLIGFGLWLHNDYGVSWDEPNNHLNGLVSVKYIAQLVAPEMVARQPNNHLIPDIRAFRDADHGVAFELPVAVLGYLFAHHDSQAYYRLRHMLIFLTFILGVWALYKIGTLCFRDWRWGLLGAILLVLSPRFFAEAFYNGKDIVYMAFFTVAVYTLCRLLERPTPGRALWHGLATALAVDVRVQGLQLLVFTAVLLWLEARAHRSGSAHTSSRSYAWAGLWYATFSVVGIVVGWPYLWSLTGAELWNALPRMGRYPWPFTNLYWGEFLPANRLPWHYILVWIGITTPLPYTLAAGLGLLSWLSTVRSSLREFNGRLMLLVVLWLVGPLVVVISAQTSLYEGWRHLYFVYPALILLAVQGARVVWSVTKRRGLVRKLALGILCLTSFEVVRTAVRMVLVHPHQNVYFSILPASTAERLFERDYWGVSYRQGLEWIMAHDTAATLAIRVPFHYPLYNNSLILPPTDRARIKYTPNDQAKYFLTAYRWHPQSYADSVGQEVYTIRAEGIKIMSVFRRP